MPMWPLWLLVFLTPVLHLLWVALLSGRLSIYSREWEVTGELSGTFEQVFWPEMLAASIAIGVWAWYHFTRRDLDRSFLSGDGWRYRSGSVPPHPGRFTAFPRPRTRASALSNMAWGPMGDWLASSYTLWPSKVHRYSIERVELPADLPAVVVVPLGWFDRVAQGMQFSPFAVESAEFNARWRVIAADARVASAVLHPRMLEYLLTDTFEGDVGITMDDAAVMVWSPGRVHREDIHWRLAAAQKFASLVPVFAYEQLGTPRPDDWGPASMTQWSGLSAVAAAAEAERPAFEGTDHEAAVHANPQLFKMGSRAVLMVGLGGVATVMSLVSGWGFLALPWAVIAGVGWYNGRTAAHRIAELEHVDVKTAWKWLSTSATSAWTARAER